MSDETNREHDDEALHASVEAEVVSSEPAEPAAADESGEPEQEADDERRAGLSKEHKQWGMFCHLAGLAGFVVPFGGIIGPLILWQMKKDESPFIDDQGKEALNFNIAAAVLITAVSIIAAVGMLFFIGILLIPVIFGITVAWVAYAVIAALKASEGVAYRYPWTFRFVK